ncbi:MAG: baseplate protein [Euryarchaeota archaeon]|mgnify:CR=1 FL=1|jgi:hypothetical protein|nr:baseplate protein [Euryarchaeota archaeon]|tara:strand:+ start:3469 stop:4173 length:705 start_codon:yes stop_codon:yes gene_type:complete
MPLPKLSIPDYECVLPRGTKVTYRPFLVREEKLLYMAMETQNQKEMIKAVKDIIKACTSIKNVNDLATFEIEYLFLRIRGKSVGEVSEFKVTCPDDDTTQVDAEVNLDEVEVIIPKEHTNIIKLDETITLTMKYPSLDVFVKNNLTDNPGIDDVFKLAADCTDTIADGDELHEAKDYKKAELVAFFEGMNSGQFQDVQKFFETMPKLQKEIEVFNPKTEVTSTVMLEGLASFFA